MGPCHQLCDDYPSAKYAREPTSVKDCESSCHVEVQSVTWKDEQEVPDKKKQRYKLRKVPESQVDAKQSGKDRHNFKTQRTMIAPSQVAWNTDRSSNRRSGSVANPARPSYPPAEPPRMLRSLRSPTRPPLSSMTTAPALPLGSAPSAWSTSRPPFFYCKSQEPRCHQLV